MAAFRFTVYISQPKRTISVMVRIKISAVAVIEQILRAPVMIVKALRVPTEL